MERCLATSSGFQFAPDHRHHRDERPGWRVEVKVRAEGIRGFTPIEKRWVVERTNAWNGRCRRRMKATEKNVVSFRIASE